METLPARRRCTKYFREMCGSQANTLAKPGNLDGHGDQKPKHDPVDELSIRGEARP
jgi:hypothetical protein